MQSDDQVEVDHSSDISFSKVRFRLHNLLSEFKILRDQESSAQKQVHRLVEEYSQSSMVRGRQLLCSYTVEKQSSLDAERGRERADFQDRLAAANDYRQKLDETIKEMSHEASGLRLTGKTFQQQLKFLLQSRNSEMEQLKAVNYQLGRKLHETSSELDKALDKLRRHSALVEAMETESISVRRAVGETRELIQVKEEELTRLQTQLEVLSCLDNKLLANSQKIIETKQNTISGLRESIEILESQIKALEVVVERSQVRIIQQEEVVESVREELVHMQDVTHNLVDKINENEEKLSSSEGSYLKLLEANSEELSRKKDLQVQIELVTKRNEELKSERTKNFGVDKAICVNDLMVRNRTSTSNCDLAPRLDQSISIDSTVKVTQQDRKSWDIDINHQEKAYSFTSPVDQSTKIRQESKGLQRMEDKLDKSCRTTSKDDLRRGGEDSQPQAQDDQGIIMVYTSKADLIIAGRNHELRSDDCVQSESEIDLGIPMQNTLEELQQESYVEGRPGIPWEGLYSVPISRLFPRDRFTQRAVCSELIASNFNENSAAPRISNSDTERPECAVSVQMDSSLGRGGPPEPDSEPLPRCCNRGSSPNLEFDVEMLLSTDLLPGLEIITGEYSDCQKDSDKKRRRVTPSGNRHFPGPPRLH